MDKKLLKKFLLLMILLPCIFVMQGCKKSGKEETKWNTMEPEGSMELLYASQFSVDYYSGGYALITIEDGGRFFVVPEDAGMPSGLDDDIVAIRQPFNNIYLVATSAMDLFRAIDGIGQIKLSGTDASRWYIEEAREAIENGDMIYAGKYNAPDYEIILANSCDLAVESTMIYHSPQVKEQLEGFGIPVLVEHSSYESHPLGRLEWIKLYGVLLGKEKEAEEYFNSQLEKVNDINTEDSGKPTVAFFYITSNGGVNVRKSNDYVAKMIEIAGGKYIFDDLGDGNALSTMNMQMESFYAQAKDADYIIYNSAVDGGIKSIDELLDKSSLLKDFKAVKEGNVWCTGKNMFQETTGICDMIVDMNNIFTEEKPDEEELVYIHKLEKEDRDGNE